MGKPAQGETLPEPPLVPRGVAEDAPDNLGILVGEGALGSLPNNIRDGRGLVEYDEDALALVVEAREGFSIPLGPGDHVDAPGTLVLGIAREEGRSRHFKVFPADEEAIPFGQLDPGLGLQLVLGVRGDDALRVLVGGDRPKNDPGNAGGFPDTVARGSGELDRFAYGDEARTEILEDTDLPQLGTGLLFKFSWLAPGKTEENEAEGVGGKLGDFFD